MVAREGVQFETASMLFLFSSQNRLKMKKRRKSQTVTDTKPPELGVCLWDVALVGNHSGR